MREAGKTLANAVAEVREAVDFLRYDAAQLRAEFDNATHRPLGPVVCISPWNFPLAIFTGQVAAALAAGNTVLAKPAEQTPLVAAEAVRLLHAAGVPAAALQLLPGPGETVGAALVADARVQGVLFTGSTQVARLLQRALAGRLGAHGQPVPLIAETGGQNAMLVDSSALVEQVVTDVVASAFDSAGQRCSALRVLCVQEDVAERLLEMLRGAMAELTLGEPARIETDVGPVIDAEAQQALLAHIDAMRAAGCSVVQAARGGDADAHDGTFVAPTLIEIDGIERLDKEVFGPVLHVLRFARTDIDALLGRINATGYGLTMGVHSRIDETIERVAGRAQVGNLYVNRNMVGAVVGVQPFGGEGLSGTGPKAGGPLYLYRLLAQRPGATPLPPVGDGQADEPAPARPALQALAAWCRAQRRGDAALCDRFAAASAAGVQRVLPGPTGERNVYRLEGRSTVLCLAEGDDDRFAQLAAVLAVGSRALWPESPAARALHAALPAEVQQAIAFTPDWRGAASPDFDAVLHHGSAEALRAVGEALAVRPGPIVGVQGLAPGDTAIVLDRLLLEHSLSVNTAAAGGNAHLMTIG